MSDEKKTTDGRDSAKIDSKDPSEVEYVHSQFPQLTHVQVVEAIAKKGPERQAVYAYLKTLK